MRNGFVLMGTSFVVSAHMQAVRKCDAIQTGVIFAAAVGIIALPLQPPNPHQEPVSWCARLSHPRLGGHRGP